MGKRVRKQRDLLDSHLADNGFNLFDRDHLDGIPGATIQKGPVGTFAGALLAPNAKKGIYFNVTKRGMVFVRHPKHTVFHRAIRDAGG